MPLYEYLCDACGHRFERIQKYSDAPIDSCPVCGGAVHKLVSSPAFHLKGSGWYATDYAKKTDATSTSTPAGESAEKSGAEKAEKAEKKEPAKESGKDAPAKESKQTKQT